MITLNKNIKNCTIIEGFPGFGLVGTIATEFLINHLKCEKVGDILLDKLQAVVAVHDKKLVAPIGLYYNSKYNILFISGITVSKNLEWEIAKKICEIAEKTKAKEIISLEGIAGSQAGKTRADFHTNKESNSKKLIKAGAEELNEGIIVGVTGALMVLSKINHTALLGETFSQLPDSKAAAELIRVLDAYLGLDVDAKPLLKQAEMFEKKLKGIIEQTTKTKGEQEKKELNYVG